MNKLESLLLEKQYLQEYVKTNKAKINEQQIVREHYLINQLGFKKINELDNMVTYKRQLLSGQEYILILDLSKPNLVCLQKSKQDKIYGFSINSIEEFIELLDFLNIF